MKDVDGILVPDTDIDALVLSHAVKTACEQMGEWYIGGKRWKFRASVTGPAYDGRVPIVFTRMPGDDYFDATKLLDDTSTVEGNAYLALRYRLHDQPEIIVRWSNDSGDYGELGIAQKYIWVE